MITYFMFGLGFYTGASLMNRKSFEGTTPFEKIKGFLFCVLLWPTAIIYLIIYDGEE